MGKTPKIIEFFGLPGAGKTTLCSDILNKRDFNYVRINVLMEQYHAESFIYKMTHIPVALWLRLSFFLILSKRLKRNDKDSILSFYYLILAYSYCKKQNTYDYLIIDHGLIQQLGSFLHNYDYSISPNSLGCFLNIIKSDNSIIPIYCHLTEAIALKRIRIRKRDNGRIDKVMDNTELANHFLYEEKSLFDSVAKGLNSKCVIIDMSQERDNIFSRFSSIVY